MDIQKKTKSIYVSALILFCVLLALLIFYNDAHGFYQPYKNLFHNGTQLKKRNAESTLISSQTKKNILLLGVDESKSSSEASWEGLTDFIMLLSIDTETEAVTALSIPRDTQLDKEIFGVSRINAANTVGGVEKVKATLEKLLALKIDNYVLVNINGFKKAMSLFGEMKVYVPKTMKYQDQKAGLNIDFKPGLENMDSEELMEFLRYRDAEDGDIGRIKRQLIFFRSFFYNLKLDEMMLKVPYLMGKVNDFFITDIEHEEAVKLVNLISSSSRKGFEAHILPGNFAKDGFWRIDYPEMNRLLEYIKHKNT